MTLRSLPPEPPLKREAACDFCGTVFTVVANRASRHTRVYQGACPSCDSWANLSYLASDKVLDRDDESPPETH